MKKKDLLKKLQEKKSRNPQPIKLKLDFDKNEDGEPDSYEKNKDYSNKELHNLNQQLIALEKSFISDQGMYFGSWYKSLYASSDPFSGYAAWILPGLEYEIALKSSDRLQEWDLRYTSAINSLTLKMKQLIQDLK